MNKRATLRCQKGLGDVFSWPGLNANYQISSFIPLIKKIARPHLKYSPLAMEFDDLVSAGMIGLLEARARFDPAKNVSFKTFATYRIRGAILDEIRQMSWLPRGAFDRINLVRKTENKLSQQIGRQVSSREVAAGLGIPLLWVHDVQRDTSKIKQDYLSNVSDSPLLRNCYSTNLPPSPFEEYEKGEGVMMTQQTLAVLSSSEAHVIKQYYWGQAPMKIIGKDLGVTEARVSQIHSQAIQELRAKYWGSPLKKVWLES